MIFSPENAGKWVATKNGKVVATAKTLDALMKRVHTRGDRTAIWFDRVPKQPYFVGTLGI